MESLLSIDVDELIFFDDEEVFGDEDLSEDLFPVAGEVVEGDDDFGVLIHGGGVVDLEVSELDGLAFDVSLTSAPADA